MLLEKFQALLAENGSLKLAQKWDTFCGEGRNHCDYHNYLCFRHSFPNVPTPLAILKMSDSQSEEGSLIENLASGFPISIWAIRLQHEFPKRYAESAKSVHQASLSSLKP